MNDSNTPRKKTIGALLFPEFELLDIFGPLEMFGVLGDDFEIVTIAETTEPVASAQGPRSVIDRCFDDATEVDVLLVPGGRGTRVEVENPQLLDYLRTLYPRLDGRSATSNKRSFAWARNCSDQVTWIAQARWVEDGNIFTAGGVAAGIDMALALIGKILDVETATAVAEGTEYEWHRDTGWDPFAAKAGLV